MTNQPQEQEDTLDTLVRDLTTVHPMPKSEVRRRLSDFIECAKAERDEEIREWAEIMLDRASGNKGATAAYNYLINFLSTPQDIKNDN